MSRDEIRFRLPPGPNQRAQALALMNELHARVVAEQEENERRAKLEADPHEVIEGEVVDGDQD